MRKANFELKIVELICLNLVEGSGTKFYFKMLQWPDRQSRCLSLVLL